METSMGSRFRAAVSEAIGQGSPLPLPGVPTAYCALLAKSAGYKALYLSGSGVAASSFGCAVFGQSLPDLAVTTLNDVVEDARRIISATELPLLVDVDTGFGTALNIARTVRDLERADAAGIHIEDQVLAKRCGHRQGKHIVALEEMVDRIKAAVAARGDPSFVIMARTDAYASEGLEGVIRRGLAYKEAGADMIFPEALQNASEFGLVAKELGIPVLANMTEFGKTPLMKAEELGSVGVAISLYPLSAFRAMSMAAMSVYEAILRDGTQAAELENMHTRLQIYDVLNYEGFERQMDELFGKEKKSKS